MAASEDFKQAIKAGELLDALKTALSESIELQITTWVSLADPYGVNQEHPQEALPGYRMHTRINIIDGEIETEVGSHFVGNSAFTELREFHINQMKSGREIIQRNLASLQQMFGLMAQVRQTELETASPQIEPSTEIAPQSPVKPTSESKPPLPIMPAAKGSDRVGESPQPPLPKTTATDSSDRSDLNIEEDEREVLAAFELDPSTDTFAEASAREKPIDDLDINETIVPQIERNTLAKTISATAAAAAVAVGVAAAANSDEEEMLEEIDAEEFPAAPATRETDDEGAETVEDFDSQPESESLGDETTAASVPTGLDLFQSEEETLARDSEDAEILGAFDEEEEEESFWEESPTVKMAGELESDQLLDETPTGDGEDDEILGAFDGDEPLGLGSDRAPDDSTFVEETDSSDDWQDLGDFESSPLADTDVGSDELLDEMPTGDGEDDEILGAFDGDEPLGLGSDRAPDDSTFVEETDSSDDWQDLGDFESSPLADTDVESDEPLDETPAGDGESAEILGAFDLEEESESFWDEPQASEAAPQSTDESQLVDPFGESSGETPAGEEDEVEILSAFDMEEESESFWDESQAAAATTAGSHPSGELSFDSQEAPTMEEGDVEILETFDTDEALDLGWEEPQVPAAASPVANGSDESQLVDPLDESSTLASLTDEDADLMSAFDPDIEAPELDEPQPYPGTTAADLGIEEREVLEDFGDEASMDLSDEAFDSSVENTDSPGYDESDPLAALLSEDLPEEGQSLSTEEAIDLDEDNELDPLAALFAEEPGDSEDPFQSEVADDDDSELLEAFNSDPFDIELAPPDPPKPHPPRSQ